MFKQISALALISSGLLSSTAYTQTWDFSQDRTYIFGDSLSDTGNLLLANGAGGPPVYFNGRFSNGPVWHEGLTGGVLALSPFLTTIAGDPSAGINFAHGGARTAGFGIGPNGSAPILPGSIEQAQAYAAMVNGGQITAPDANDLFAVWIGGNNFLAARDGSPIDIAQGVADIQLTLSTLAETGARRFLLFSVPPVGTTVDIPPPFDAQFDLAVSQFNQGLRGVDAAVSAQYGADILFINTEALFLDAYEAPELYGFSEVDTDCVSQGLLLTDCPSDWSDYDGIHPTTQAHAVLAQFIVATGANADYAAQTFGGFTELAYQLNREAVSTGLDDVVQARHGTGGWISTGWLDAEIDADSNRAGVDYDGWQVAAGYSVPLTDQIFIAGQARYADVDGDVLSPLAGRGETEYFGVTVYAGWSAEQFYLLGAAGLGSTVTDTVRATGFDPRASVESQLDLDQVHYALEAGYDLKGENWTLTPYLRGVITNFDSNPFIESGPLLAGRSEAIDFDSTLIEAGFRGHWQLSEAQSLSLGLAYQTEDDGERSLGLLLNDIDLSQAVIEAADDSLVRARFRYAFAIKESLHLGLDAGGDFGDATTAYDFRLTATKAF